MATPVTTRSAVSATGERHSTLVSSSVASANTALRRDLWTSDMSDSLAGLARLCAIRYVPPARAPAVNG
jgi:hypothetical protein